jgi:hypothetical protein
MEDAVAAPSISALLNAASTQDELETGLTDDETAAETTSTDAGVTEGDSGVEGTEGLTATPHNYYDKAANYGQNYMNHGSGGPGGYTSNYDSTYDPNYRPNYNSG